MSGFQAPSRRCVMCQYERPELELPCGCAIHGRCCPLWPIECCPWCAKPVEPGKRARVLPMVVAEPMFGEAMVGSCRRGRWDEACALTCHAPGGPGLACAVHWPPYRRTLDRAVRELGALTAITAVLTRRRRYREDENERAHRGSMARPRGLRQVQDDPRSGPRGLGLTCFDIKQLETQCRNTRAPSS